MAMILINLRNIVQLEDLLYVCVQVCTFLRARLSADRHQELVFQWTGPFGAS